MQKSLFYGLFTVAMVLISNSIYGSDKVNYRKTGRQIGTCFDHVAGASSGVAALKFAGFANATTYAVAGIPGVSTLVTTMLPWTRWVAGAGAMYWLARSWCMGGAFADRAVEVGKRIGVAMLYTIGSVAVLAALKKANT